MNNIIIVISAIFGIKWFHFLNFEKNVMCNIFFLILSKITKKEPFGSENYTDILETIKSEKVMP